MGSKDDLERAVSELQKATGLALTLGECDADAEEILEKLNMLTGAFRDRYDRNGFIRRLLLGSIDGDEIFPAAARFHIPENLMRTVYLIECGNSTTDDAAKIMKSLFLTRTSDLFAVLDERRMVLIKAVQSYETAEDAATLAHTIVDMLNAEAMMRVRVGYDKPSESLQSLTESYRHAATASEIGKIFYAGENVLEYNNLGVGRLVHDLPEESMRLFLKEVFGSGSAADLDADTLEIINAFFENNLNISETARHLYVHRNTLVYRLEKLSAATGLDLRNFDDALKLKLALMISDDLAARKE